MRLISEREKVTKFSTCNQCIFIGNSVFRPYYYIQLFELDKLYLDNKRCIYYCILKLVYQRNLFLYTPNWLALSNPKGRISRAVSESELFNRSLK